MIPGHLPDPDAVGSASPAVHAYIDTVERLGRAAPPPTAQYAYGADRGQALDVYAPPGARGLPMLLFLHGGAWIAGHRGWLRFMAPAVTAMPAILVAATYRLAPRWRWPAQREDVLAALAFVREHATAWGGDRARIVIGGHSAGGQLAALAALQPDPGAVACMPVSAPLSLEHGDVPADSDRGRVYRYLLADRADDAGASPLNHLDSGTVPFHLMRGERDLDHVIASNDAAFARMTAAGRSVTYKVQAGASHFDTHVALADSASPWHARLREALAAPRASARHAA